VGVVASFKVRLEDGVEVGPLDAQMLRSWWQQGMVKRDTPVRQVQPTAGSRWVRLADAMDIGDWGGAGGSRARSRHRAGSEADLDEEDEVTSAGPEKWRTYAGSVLLFLIAGAAGYLAFFPSLLVPALQRAPWREIALGHVALALLLVRGWEPARKAVRVLVCLLTFSLFPLAAPIIVEGLGKGIEARALLALFSAWVMGSGLFFFLAGRAMPRKSIALCLLWIVVGAAGAGYFALANPPMVAALR
jgi:hypothetical protein